MITKSVKGEKMFRFNLKVMAATLSASAAAIYLLCVLFRPIFPNWAMYTSDFWAAAFPGFSWSVLGILIGLVESSLYGFLAALIFVPLYNFFAARLGDQ
jgi:hypothetical protein